MNELADVLSGSSRWCTILGDCRDTLRSLPDACVQTCVTSPPYYWLRDYGADGQIGRETSPEAYITELVAVFREVRRVLRGDGTLWLNLGDSYAAHPAGQARNPSARSPLSGGRAHGEVAHRAKHGRASGIPKNLLLLPHRVALALHADGWIVRSDIVWAKPNPMPEPVRDRPTRAHEYVFLFTKRARYFYDQGAVREPVAASTRADARIGTGRVRDYAGAAADFGTGTSGSRRNATGVVGSLDGRNARDVWTLAPEPYAGAHFATMPPELARRCIRAGSRRGDVVLDPFGGSGTTARVALEEGRRAILCELNPEYVALQRERIAPVDTDASEPVRVAADADHGPLFGGS